MWMTSWVAILAAAASSVYYDDENWSVHDNDDSCAAMASYQRGTTLWVSHEHGLNRTTFIITDPALKSVSDGKKYKLDLFFVKNGKLDNGWGAVDVSGLTFESGANGIRFVLRGAEALDDLATSTGIALMRDDIVVESLTLRGSAPVVVKLRDCARKVHLRNPSDPLEGAEQVDRNP